MLIKETYIVRYMGRFVMMYRTEDSRYFIEHYSVMRDTYLGMAEISADKAMELLKH